jgi:hypothetical protein
MGNYQKLVIKHQIDKPSAGFTFFGSSFALLMGVAVPVLEFAACVLACDLFYKKSKNNLP